MWHKKTLLYVLVLLTEYHKSCVAIEGDRLSKGEFLSKSQAITSEKGTFELGFFSPPGSSNKIYLAIWYKSITERTTVWIANRERPVFNTSSPAFGISQDGNLVLMSEQETIWSTNLDFPSTSPLESVLLESGNFVLRDVSNSSDILWQSFDHPTDTWLPGAKFGYNRLTGKSLYLMSWKNPEDPSSGMYSVQLDNTAALMQYVLQWDMSRTYSTSGYWDGKIFRFFPEFSYTAQFSFTSNEKETYFTYAPFNNETLLRLVISPSGEFKQLAYRRGLQGWTTIFTQPRSITDIFELPKTSGDKEKLKIIVSSVVSAAVILIGGSMGYLCTKKIKEKGNKASGEDLLSFDFDCSNSTQEDQTIEINNLKRGRKKDYDLPSFSYASVTAATDSFSAGNKLGEGGFGPVYKGKSLNGHEIAVKRLSKGSKQGIEEFKNEIVLIAKLQHRNLVRLLGCCFDRDENILIYEYMPNKSLDTFLFDSNKKEMLEWRIRVRIIEGIAQGLLYLHEYSRIHIIHRDLKAGNILLDSEMNPKISDFGLARIFGGKDSQANTNRVVGTYGYMAPEYALQGLFSVKSDVFSFGVLLLEIISGKKNTGFYQTDSLNLLGYAWELWTCNRAEDLKDSAIDCVPVSELLRYINIGLLCVQEDPNDRPTMSKIVSMISNEVATLPQPNQPAFSISRIGRNDINQASTSVGNCSVNGLTVSMIQPR